MKRLFHYTTGLNLKDILSQGVIKIGTAAINTKKEKPAVWFTYGEKWEGCCNKLLVPTHDKEKFQSLMRELRFDELNERAAKSATMEQTAQMCDGLFRIEVDPIAAPLRFHEWATQSGVDPEIAKSLKWTTKKLHGSHTSLWRASFEPVDSRHWLAVDAICVEGELVPFAPWRTVWSRGPRDGDHRKQSILTLAKSLRDATVEEFVEMNDPRDTAFDAEGGLVE